MSKEDEKTGSAGTGKPLKPEVRLNISEAVSRGVYANSMMVSHTKDEFILDFINAFPPQPSMVARVITNPGHLKRLIKTLRGNVEKYEMKHGIVPEPPAPADPQDRPKVQLVPKGTKPEGAPGAPGQKQGVRVNVPEFVSRGAYSNSMMVSHTREEFVLDFLHTFPPQATVTARVITSPGHLRRLIRALEENLEKYEKKFGPILEGPAPPEVPGSQYVM